MPKALAAIALVSVTVFAGPLACEDRQPATSADYWTVPMRIGGKTFTLEVANTPSARQTGLMYRKTLPPDRGVIFVFDSERELGFWMKNTYLPLDVIYLDAKGKVVSIHPLEPLSEANVSSAAPARYAIELNRGAAAESGVKPGDVLEVPERAREPRQ